MIHKDAEVLYFAYGANRDVRMIAAITGTPADELIGHHAILRGYALGVQKLDQIPDVVLPDAPLPESPRQTLHDSWGEDFESYVIVKDPDSQVDGTIWGLTREQRELVRYWELLDFGWFHDETAVAYLDDGTAVDVAIEAIDDSQELDRRVDGLHYETWTMPAEDLERVAIASRPKP